MQYWGIIAKLLSLVTFSLLSVIFLSINLSLNVIDQLFVICSSGSLILAPLVFGTKLKRNILHIKQLKFYIMRTILSIIGTISWFKSLKEIGMNDTTLISYLIPIMTVIFASIFCEEKVNYIAILGMSLCVIVISNTYYDQEHINIRGLLFALLSAISWALYNVICKKQTKTEHYLVQCFIILALSAIITYPAISSNLTISNFPWLFAIIAGLLRVLGNVFLFISFSYVSVNVLMLINYMQFPIAAILSYAAFGSLVSLNQIIGVVTIIIVNTFIMLSKKQTKKFILSR